MFFIDSLEMRAEYYVFISILTISSLPIHKKRENCAKEKSKLLRLPVRVPWRLNKVTRSAMESYDKYLHIEDGVHIREGNLGAKR